MFGSNLQAGQFVTFTYNPPAKPPRQRYQWVQQQVRGPDGITRMRNVMVPSKAPPIPPSDPHKHVLVLHPNWQGHVHAVDMARVSPAEQQVLHAVMDPSVKAAVASGQWPVEGVPPYNLIRDILSRMDPTELIKTPLAFYQRLIKPFIRDKDVYRQYFPQFVNNVQVVRESKVVGQVTNQKPLFKKI